MTTNPIVDVDHLNVIFDGFYAVRDVSFCVRPGEIFGFLGANGAGKTTTIRVLCGLLPTSSGAVTIDGVRFVRGRENMIKQRVGYMSQRFTLYDELSVRENFDFAAALRAVSPDDYIQRRHDLLKFIGFSRDLSTIVRHLPGGIKQEVALGVALLHDPKIIFLDEPTAGVAPAARMRFWRLIKKLSRQGKTIFVTTHYMDEAENCHRVALMRSGEMIACASPATLKRRTFGDTLMNFTPRRSHVKLPPAGLMDICEPYGRHYHIRFHDGVDRDKMVAKYARDFDIQKISPSLEDVFIRLVEGGEK